MVGCALAPGDEWAAAVQAVLEEASAHIEFSERSDDHYSIAATSGSMAVLAAKAAFKTFAARTYYRLLSPGSGAGLL